MASATEVQKSAFRLRFTALHKYQNRYTQAKQTMRLFNLFKKTKAIENQAEDITLSSNSDKTPRLIIVMGGVCTGKTTHRKDKYPSKDYIHIDAGEIFINLSQGEYFDFPSHLDEKINLIGLEKCHNSIFNRDNIVLEIIGADYEEVENIIELSKQIHYKATIDYIECDMEEAWQRNINRSNDNISAHYCEPYHLYWFKKAASEYLNR